MGRPLQTPVRTQIRDFSTPMTRRIRLGVFVNDLLSPYQIRLFNSLKRAAEAQGVRLIGFQGSYLINPEQERRTAFDGSFVYGLAGEESVERSHHCIECII